MKDGKERWHKSICDLDQMYYGSVAPVVINNHVIVGVSGDDMDIPGYLQSRDPENGDLQWQRIANDSRPRPALTALGDEIAAQLKENPSAFEEMRDSDFDKPK